MQINLKPFPEIQTERLLLRKLTLSDSAGIFGLRSNDDVNRYLGRQKCTSIQEAGDFIRKIEALIDKEQSLYWAINLIDNPQLIGTICLWNLSFEKESVDLGYELDPAYQGQGIMQEAVAAVIAYAFNKMQAKMITAFTHPDNAASVKLLTRSGFTPDEKHIYVSEEEAEGQEVYFLLNK